MPDDPSPLILTLALAGPDQARFDALRRAHFPPERNHIGAHVTMFHSLPGEELELIQHQLASACAVHPPGPVAVTGLRSLGRGVAFVLHAPSVAALRAGLARAWHGQLTAQDRQGWRPHVTIQNKVAPAEAATLLARMQAHFSPFAVQAEGLALWRYRGGPWTPVATFAFGGGTLAKQAGIGQTSQP